MHHLLYRLDLHSGHTDLNHENDKCLIISETVPAMPKFVVKVVRLKVYIILSQSDDLALHKRSQHRVKREKFIADSIQAIAFNLGMTVDLCMAYNYAHARFDDLDLDARSQWDGRGKISSFNNLGK